MPKVKPSEPPRWWLDQRREWLRWKRPSALIWVRGDTVWMGDKLGGDKARWSSIFDLPRSVLLQLHRIGEAYDAELFCVRIDTHQHRLGFPEYSVSYVGKLI